MSRIEEVLQPIPPDQRQVRFSFGCRDTGYTARVMLTLPTGSVVARTAAPVADHRAAIDEVVDRLGAEIRRHRGQVHEDGVQGRRRRRERDFAAAGPHLNALRSEKDREGFFDVLHPLLRELRNHAKRELIIAQLEGTIRPGELTVGDLLDEALVRAWEWWDDRPPNQPLDRWLVGLIHEILDERGFHPPDAPRRQTAAPAGDNPPREPQSVYDRVRVDDRRNGARTAAEAETNPSGPWEAENGWAVENNPYWPFVDSLTWDDALPADGSAEPWQHLAAEEERRAILDELRKFPKEQRRAFTLHALEGWNVLDIATLQGRSAEEVRRDIEAVREGLRQRLQKAMA